MNYITKMEYEKELIVAEINELEARAETLKKRLQLKELEIEEEKAKHAPYSDIDENDIF